MKAGFGAFLILWPLFLVTVPAEAAIQQKDTVSGYDCAGDMTTENCFTSPTGTAFSGPTTTACYAKGRNGQRCRRCEPDHYPDGQPTGYNTCNYVAEVAACDCVFISTYGSPGKKCSGNTPSTCDYIW